MSRKAPLRCASIGRPSADNTIHAPCASPEPYRVTAEDSTPGKPRKVLVIGSGPIVIGQAAEFDYAGTQACRALREEGVTTVLVNSNPATIMTDEDIADSVYIEPLTVEVVERIIQRERPDGVLPTLGGQTGLNLAVELADAGIFEKYDVRLLGTPLETIKDAEDRERFRSLLAAIGEPTPPSEIVGSLGGGEDRRREARPSPSDPSRLHAGRYGRRGRRDTGGARDHRAPRPRRQPHHAGAGGEVAWWAGKKSSTR